MTSFPLYDNLIKDIEPNVEPLNKAKKEKLISDIKLLDNNGHELIYTLIKVHHIENDEQDYKLPYGMKSLKLGLRTDINQLPYTLQHIINNFVKLHLETQ